MKDFTTYEKAVHPREDFDDLCRWEQDLLAIERLRDAIVKGHDFEGLLKALRERMRELYVYLGMSELHYSKAVIQETADTLQLCQDPRDIQITIPSDTFGKWREMIRREELREGRR